MSRTAIKQIELFKLEELSNEQQETAYLNWCQSTDYAWGNDNEKVLDKFCRIFPVKVGDWEYGYHNYINGYTTCNDEVSELRGIRLATYIWNNYFSDIFKGKYFSTGKYVNGKYIYKHRHSKVMFENSCVLTGYCIDDDILEPIYNFLKKPYDITFDKLIDECLNSWINACNKDYDSYYSMENFKEESENNDWEFTADGEIYY